MKTPKLSVVVPCFNEEAVIEALRDRLTDVCKNTMEDDYEIILVDDGSSDATLSIIERFSQEDPHFVSVSLSRNHGHQLALTAGLTVARGERVLIIDADLQDPPELLPDMMALMDEGNDVVYGQRISREGETAFKKLTAAMFYRLFQKLVDVDVPVDTGDFRLISRRALDILMSMPEQHRFIRGMVSWIGFQQCALPYKRHERYAGETKYPLRKMLLFAADAITGFSIMPLRLAMWLGLLSSLMAIPIGMHALWGWANGDNIAGWTSSILVILVIGGMQLFMIGILGEYVGRMYIQVKGRPLFIIKNISRKNTDNSTDNNTNETG